MTLASGFTTFGIIRKRLADIYADFALRIKEGGVFGTQTTADEPDLFATDPLVQIMTTTGASLHEVWEAVELWYSQLDPNTASGAYLEHLHGNRFGIARATGQSDADYRALILAALQRPTRNNLLTIIEARDDVECAALLASTTAAPIEGIPAPGNAIVVKGCAVDYASIAEQLYNSVELGLHQFYGDIVASYKPANGGCVTYRFMEAIPVFAAIEVHGYFTEVCGSNDPDTIRAAVLAALNARLGVCALGGVFSSPLALASIGTLDGFVVTSVRVARRARQLWGSGCDAADAVRVTLCGVETPWATSITCGPGAGEVWCDPAEGCMTLAPWEYLAFDLDFVTLVEDATQGGCL